MLRSFLMLFLVVFSSKVLSNEDKVAIVVDNTIITEKEILDRRNFFLQAQNSGNLNEQDLTVLKEAATQSLIDEVLLEGEVKKYSLKVTEQNIENFIKSVEASKQLGEGFFKKKFAGNKGVYASFLKKVRGDFIKTKINNEVLMRGIVVSAAEVDDVALRYIGKDVTLEVREFKTSSDSAKASQNFKKVKNTHKNCAVPVKSKEYSVETWQKKLSEIPLEQKSLLADLKEGEFSAVVNHENGLVMYQICSKKIEGITEQENDNLTNYIGNKKLTFKMLKYLETLRSKAYIKVM